MFYKKKAQFLIAFIILQIGFHHWVNLKLTCYIIKVNNLNALVYLVEWEFDLPEEDSGVTDPPDGELNHQVDKYNCCSNNKLAN